MNPSLHETFSLDVFLKIQPYLFTLGASSILLVYHVISYYFTKDKLVKDFCMYLLAISIYLLYAILGNMLQIEDNTLLRKLTVLKECLEILTYYFYINYTTKAIGFDENKHKILNVIIKMTLQLMLIYIPLQFIWLFGFGMVSNLYLFVGIRLIIFSLALVMFYQSFKIRGNKLLAYIQTATSIYFILSLNSFILSLFYTKDSTILPYHLILLGTLIDLIIFSTAMSNRIKHQIINAQKSASEKELELKSYKYKQALELKEQIDHDRKQLSMDLHDDIGASLSSIIINSELAKNISKNESTNLNNLLNNIAIQSKEISSRLADFIWSLKYERSTFNSLKQRLLDHQQQLFDVKDIKCNYHIEETLLENSPVLTKNILLIIKEAMNNISKYANATEVNIKLYFENNIMLLIINDDGVGFDKNKIKMGNGLSNMKKRCESNGGTFSILSNPIEGSEIRCMWNIV